MNSLRDGQRMRAWKDLAYGDVIRFSITRNSSKSGFFEAGILSFVPVAKRLCLPPDSIMFIDNTCAQVLMDDLWNCGIRPTEGAGTAGAMGAVQGHLNDMRAIVSKKLGIILP